MIGEASGCARSGTTRPQPAGGTRSIGSSMTDHCFKFGAVLVDNLETHTRESPPEGSSLARGVFSRPRRCSLGEIRATGVVSSYGRRVDHARVIKVPRSRVRDANGPGNSHVRAGKRLTWGRDPGRVGDQEGRTVTLAAASLQASIKTHVRPVIVDNGNCRREKAPARSFPRPGHSG